MRKAVLDQTAHLSLKRPLCSNVPRMGLIDLQAQNESTETETALIVALCKCARDLPACSWRQNDVVLTSMQPRYVASTSIQRHFNVICVLGLMHLICCTKGLHDILLRNVFKEKCFCKERVRLSVQCFVFFYVLIYSCNKTCLQIVI